MLNLAGIVKEFCNGRNLPVPSSVQSSSDAQVRQMVAILNEMNLDLLTRRYSQYNVVQAIFTSAAADNQGSIHNLARFGFEGIVSRTMWDRATNMPVIGGTDESDWAWLRSFTPPSQVAGANQYRIKRDQLYFLPPLPAGHEIRFEYISSFFVRDPVTVATPYKDLWALDTDLCVFGDQIPRAWLAWKWPQKKGFDYAEEFAAYERLLLTKLNYANAPEIARMDTVPGDGRPGVFVQPGNWPLSN